MSKHLCRQKNRVAASFCDWTEMTIIVTELPPSCFSSEEVFWHGPHPYGALSNACFTHLFYLFPLRFTKLYLPSAYLVVLRFNALQRSGGLVDSLSTVKLYVFRRFERLQLVFCQAEPKSWLRRCDATNDSHIFREGGAWNKLPAILEWNGTSSALRTKF